MTTTTTSRPNYKAVKNADGTFNILDTSEGSFENVPYIGLYDNYREMDAEAELMRKIYAETGYVCRASHDKENEYVFFYPLPVGKKDEYIVI